MDQQSRYRMPQPDPNDVALMWVCTAGSFVCCFLLGFVGLHYSRKAEEQGYQPAGIAQTLCWISIVLNCMAMLFILAARNSTSSPTPGFGTSQITTIDENGNSRPLNAAEAAGLRPLIEASKRKADAAHPVRPISPRTRQPIEGFVRPSSR